VRPGCPAAQPFAHAPGQTKKKKKKKKKKKEEVVVVMSGLS
jgi:hypothetical protein